MRNANEFRSRADLSIYGMTQIYPRRIIGRPGLIGSEHFNSAEYDRLSCLEIHEMDSDPGKKYKDEDNEQDQDEYEIDDRWP